MKKITQILFCLALLTVFAFSLDSYAAEAYELREQSALLSALEITDDANWADDDVAVTRAEFAKLAVRLSGCDAAMPANGSFTDISNSEYNDYILTALNLNIISDAETFRPLDGITRDEALVMTVSALGGREFANVIGSGMDGFINLSARMGLAKGCDKIIMTRRDAVTMLDNALRSYVIECEYLDETYSLSSSKIYLEEKFKVSRYEGIIEENSYTGLYSLKGAGKGCVSVNGKTYKDTVGASEFLGRNVYYYLNDSKTNIVCISPKYDDDVLTVDSFDFENIEDGKLNYSVDGDEKEARISKKPIYLLNGTFVSEGKVPENITYGKYTLADFDDNGVYDIISITDLKVYKIKGISKIKSEIYFEDTDDFAAFDTDDDIIVTKNNAKINPDELKIGDVVTFEKSASSDINYCKLDVITNKSVSKITGVDKEDNRIVIDGNTYDILKNIDVKTGLYGTFYLDGARRVVYFDNDISVVYGYITAMHDEAMSDDIYAKIYTERGRWVSLKFADKVTLNGKKGALPKDIYVLPEFKSGSNFNHQLISYKVNGDNEITEFNTARTAYTPWSDEEKAAIDSGLLVLTANESSAYYRRSTYNLAGKIFLQSDTVIFLIAYGVGDTVKDGDIKIVTMSGLSDGASYPNVKSYNRTEYGATPAVVINDSRYTYGFSQFALVTEISTGLDGDGCSTGVLKCYMNGTEYSVFIDDSLNGVFKEGDVISVSLDGNGYVKNYRVRASLGADVIPPFTSGKNTDSYSYILGTVKSYDSASSMLTVDYGGEIDTCILDSGAVILVYEKGKRKSIVSTGSVDDVLDGKTVFLKKNYGKVQNAVVVVD